MNTPFNKSIVAALLGIVSAAMLQAQTSAFTYQGQLTDNSSPANGIYDLRFSIYDADTGGTEVAGPVTHSPVAVSNGMFTVALDFGSAVFDGSDCWLEIEVKTNGSGAFNTLNPRQQITSTPYAVRAASANTLETGIVSDPTFLGTTTVAPLQVRVNNQVGWRLEYPTLGTVPNLVGGDSGNSVGVEAQGAVIAGGSANTIGLDADFSMIGGGQDNHTGADAWWTTVGGGYLNNIGANTAWSTIGGGYNNNIVSNAVGATIAGGIGSSIGWAATYSTIGGGQANNIGNLSGYPTIAGGLGNEIGVAAGQSVISGGFENSILDNGDYAAIPGGYQNAATNYAFAAGRRSKAIHTGSFVWADSENADFPSTTDNQFRIRASGGVAIGSDTSPSYVDVMGNIISRGASGGMFLSYNPNDQDATVRLDWLNDQARIRIGGSGAGSGNGLAIQRAGNATLMYVSNSGDVTANSFTPTSDRNAKENFEPVDPLAVLRRVVEMSITRWNFREDEKQTRHIGPMAQDFNAAFGVGPDDKHIATVDADGVALAAIQGLNRKLEQKETEIADLRQRLQRLEQLISNLTSKGGQL